jgi:hypothetical protein
MKERSCFLFLLKYDMPQFYREPFFSMLLLSIGCNVDVGEDLIMRESSSEIFRFFAILGDDVLHVRHNCSQLLLLFRNMKQASSLHQD